MAKAGGPRPGAGRKPGSRNKRTSLIIADAVAAGITPVEYMLRILQDETAAPEARAWAAEKAAPFVHPRPGPAAEKICLDLPDTSTAEGVRNAMGAVVRAVAEGEITPSEAQSLIGVLDAQRKAIETADILPRLEALELARQDGNGKRRFAS